MRGCCWTPTLTSLCTTTMSTSTQTATLDGLGPWVTERPPTRRRRRDEATSNKRVTFGPWKSSELVETQVKGIVSGKDVSGHNYRPGNCVRERGFRTQLSELVDSENSPPRNCVRRRRFRTQLSAPTNSRLRPRDHWGLAGGCGAECLCEVEVPARGHPVRKPRLCRPGMGGCSS